MRVAFLRLAHVARDRVGHIVLSVSLQSARSGIARFSKSLDMLIVVSTAPSMSYTHCGISFISDPACRYIASVFSIGEPACTAWDGPRISPPFERVQAVADSRVPHPPRYQTPVPAARPCRPGRGAWRSSLSCEIRHDSRCCGPNHVVHIQAEFDQPGKEVGIAAYMCFIVRLP